MSPAERGLLESELRVALWRQFRGEVEMRGVSPDGQDCVVAHKNGLRGVLPVEAIVSDGLEVRRRLSFCGTDVQDLTPWMVTVGDGRLSVRPRWWRWRRRMWLALLAAVLLVGLLGWMRMGRAGCSWHGRDRSMDDADGLPALADKSVRLTERQRRELEEKFCIPRSMFDGDR